MNAILNQNSPFSAIQYFDYASIALGLMQADDKDNWDKFVILSEDPNLDIQAAVSAGVIDTDPDDPNWITGLSVMLGKWEVYISLDESTWRYRSAPGDTVYIQLSFKLNDQWCARPSFYLDYKNHTIVDMDVVEIFAVLYRQVKQRLSVTIREYEKYLADKAKYDNLRKVFNINPRKKP